MLVQAQPDCVIVTTVDCFHQEYIIRAMEAGCDVITEKPMTIDAEKCRAIFSAERRTGKKLTVTFNYRFTPFTTRIKEAIQSGVIGNVLSVEAPLWKNAEIIDISHFCTGLPANIEPEITSPVTWTLEYFIAFALLEKYVDSVGSVTGQEWRVNFYKCAHNNTHPHWASWNPLPELNFHAPDAFGRIQFS